MPAVLPASRGVRVAGEVLVVPPFECAWLSGEGSEPSGDGGSVSFEAKGPSDVTVMLKPHGARTRRLDHWSGRLDGAAASDEHTYLVIIGSHRNSCLCIERDGVVAVGEQHPRPHRLGQAHLRVHRLRRDVAPCHQLVWYKS